MKSDHNEAVSTVIALMLILAILSTCIAIYSATYIPGLKQQSEILHSEEVQYAFQRLSSDVDNLYSLGRPAQFSEPVPLGGGDILLSLVKSSGTIELQKKNIVSITVGGEEFDVETTSVSYTPSYSSWELQGYLYQNGVVWITKGTKKTPADLILHTVKMGTDQESETINKWLTAMRPVPSGENYTMQIVSMIPADGKSSVTGSGIAKIRLNAVAVKEKTYHNTSIMFDSEPILSSVNVTLKILQIEVSVT
ncbi:hypothetical protein [Methanorbis furvi]|uniref:Archaeal Type IV pilin N-terminal domain-containing protein n=1 Tax=Methanorbis furvi TaxID=3028299 RepID=A0AAE4MBF5_9EURY|nr:hypothetical protein [Methanocorpusculaceae archaeon Ag1]